ncbi:MAG: hypothetical protein J0L66_09705 [Cytophagales bacterium]|nr:hypothetical protein [Cytophagales bacterium]
MKVVCIGFIFMLSTGAFAQELYTARSFWEETKKETYRKIAERKLKGDTLTDAEETYLVDYEKYLAGYYERLSDEEKRKYLSLKNQWDLEVSASQQTTTPSQATSTAQPDFELRTRDKLINGAYGALYGIMLVGGAEIEGPGTAGLIPIMAGLWQLGPVINKKKYANINATTIRAGNSGRFIGLMDGAFLGLALAGDSESSGNLPLLFSVASSISLGEIAFQTQKRKNFSEGHIEMMRHYAFLGTGVSGLVLATSDIGDAQALGAGLLAGNIAGLAIGHNMARNYNYSQGDVDVISSLTWIGAGLGFALVAEGIDGTGGPGLFLLPAVTSVAASLLGQKAVKGIYFTKAQGNIISYAAGGAALVGLGLMIVVEAESGALALGIPSLFALIAHQAMFRSYKRENLSELKLGHNEKKRVQVSMKLTPENYLTNRQTGQKIIQTGSLAAPLVHLRLRF